MLIAKHRTKKKKKKSEHVMKINIQMCTRIGRCCYILSIFSYSPNEKTELVPTEVGTLYLLNK